MAKDKEKQKDKEQPKPKNDNDGKRGFEEALVKSCPKAEEKKK